MPTKEEIREVLVTLCCVAKAKDLSKSPTGFDDEVNGALLELYDLGVVRKVDRELPHCDICYGTGRCTFVAKGNHEATEHPCPLGCGEVEAGYIAVEPLI